MSDLPLSAAEFEGLMQPFLPLGERVAVAVSGGADSMALAYCLKCLINNGVQLVALIVDHRLRPESAQEAQTVSARLGAVGIASEILPWLHGPIETRIHVRARQARYALLLEACKRNGTETLFLAHHADDQAETVLMRLAKGSGIDGLAGIAPMTEMEGIRLARPLLSVPKVRLVATCTVAGIETVTDPSNEKEKYARGRLRRVMQSLAQEGLSVERLTDMAARAREAKEALDFYAQDFLQNHATVDESGAIRLDLAALAQQQEAVAQRVVAACLMALRGGDYPPERELLLPFMDWLLSKSEQETRTLHGCLVHKNEEKRTATILRELAAITHAPSIHMGETVLWDGRWFVTLHAARTGLSLRPLGAAQHEVLDALAPTLRRRIPSGRARAVLPALWENDTLVAIPDFFQNNQQVVAATRKPFFWEKKEVKG